MDAVGIALAYLPRPVPGQLRPLACRESEQARVGIVKAICSKPISQHAQFGLERNLTGLCGRNDRFASRARIANSRYRL